MYAKCAAECYALIYNICYVPTANKQLNAVPTHVLSRTSFLSIVLSAIMTAATANTHTLQARHWPYPRVLQPGVQRAAAHWHGPVAR
jgi:hypothetical protein